MITNPQIFTMCGMVNTLRENDMRRLDIMNRGTAIAYCKHEHISKTIMISISTSYIDYEEEPYIGNGNNIVDILRVSFVDADGVGDLDVYGNKADESMMFSDEQASQIVEFVKAHEDCNIIVHCDAGISRSSAVAASILRFYSGNDDSIFNSRYYAPNMWVYYKMLKAFGIDYAADGEIDGDI